MPKLSKNQLEVLRLMSEGWELGRSHGFDGDRPWWMQKGGLGRGGDSKKVNSNTTFSLYKKGLIYKPDPKTEFPTEHWALTEKGKEAIK